MPRIGLYNPVQNTMFKATVGMLSNSGDRFAVEVKPEAVIKYTPSNPAGITLTETTSTPGTGQWQYSSGQVILGDSLNQGETVVAIIGSEALLETVTTLANTTYFDVSQSDASYRTKIQKVRMMWIGVGEELQNVTISVEDVLANTGSEPARYSLAPDVDGQPGEFRTTLTSADIPQLASLKWLQSVDFWVKCVVPEGSTVGNFADVMINISGVRYRYPRESYAITVSNGRVIIPTGFSHHYYLLFFRYVSPDAAYTYYGFPYLMYDESTSQLYVVADNPLTNARTDIYYMLQPIDHLVGTDWLSTIEFDPYPALPGGDTFLGSLVLRYTSAPPRICVSLEPSSTKKWSVNAPGYYHLLYYHPNFRWLIGRTGNVSTLYSQLASKLSETTTTPSITSQAESSSSNYGRFTCTMEPYSLICFHPYNPSLATLTVRVYAPFSLSFDTNEVFMTWYRTATTITPVQAQLGNPPCFYRYIAP